MSLIVDRMLARLGFLCVVIVGLALNAAGQSYGNTVTFSNHSGEDAVVKVIGPARAVVAVSNGSEGAVQVPAGRYYILVRYCDRSNRCSYSRGDAFAVEETTNAYSDILITLHKVVNGNYGSRSTSGAEFESH